MASSTRAVSPSNSGFSSWSKSSTVVPCPEYCSASTSPARLDTTRSLIISTIRSRVAFRFVSRSTSNPACSKAAFQGSASATQPSSLYCAG